MNIQKRIISPTPPFFQKLRTAGLMLAAISSAVLTAPVSLPAIVTSIAGYTGLAGGIISTVCQLTVEEMPTAKPADVPKPKPGKRKEKS